MLKEYNLKGAVDNLDLVWKSISLKKYLKELWTEPICGTEELEDQESHDDNLPLSELRKRLCVVNVSDLKAITDSLNIIDPENDLTSNDIMQWATGERHYCRPNRRRQNKRGNS